jgi:hypothetical protein
MQSARALFYGDHAVETAASLKGHGDLHGRGNVDMVAKTKAFDKSIGMKFLNVFPSAMRVPSQ